MNKKLFVIFLSLLGTATAAMMVSGIKLLSQDLNPFIIAFYRCLFGVIIMMPFMLYSHPQVWKTHNLKLQFIRCSINVYSMISWFTAIGTMQLEKAAAIGFTTPLFTTILAIIFLGEVIKIQRITALIVGFIGILVVVVLFIGEAELNKKLLAPALAGGESEATGVVYAVAGLNVVISFLAGYFLLKNFNIKF